MISSLRFSQGAHLVKEIKCKKYSLIYY